MPNDTIKSLLHEAVRDVRNLTEAKIELLQLKLADKGSTAAAGGLYAFFLFLLGKLSIILLFVNIGFSFTLLFIQSAAVLEIIKGLLFGFLCALGVILLIMGIMLLMKKTFTETVRSKVINKVIDQLEAQEKERVVKRAMKSINEIRSNGECPADEIDITNQINE